MIDICYQEFISFILYPWYDCWDNSFFPSFLVLVQKPLHKRSESEFVFSSSFQSSRFFWGPTNIIKVLPSKMIALLPSITSTCKKRIYRINECKKKENCKEERKENCKERVAHKMNALKIDGDYIKNFLEGKGIFLDIFYLILRYPSRISLAASASISPSIQASSKPICASLVVRRSS